MGAPRAEGARKYSARPSTRQVRRSYRPPRLFRPHYMGFSSGQLSAGGVGRLFPLSRSRTRLSHRLAPAPRGGGLHGRRATPARDIIKLSSCSFHYPTAAAATVKARRPPTAALKP